MKIVEVDHPLVRHKLGKLRDISTDPVHFRQFAGEIAALLAFEATRDLPTQAIRVDTWAGPLQVDHVRGEDLTLVPILRAGLGFLPGVQALLPAAPVSVVGLRRNEATHQPEGYYQRLADRMEQRTALLIDPMLATGGSAIAAIQLLKNAGCRRIKCIFLVAAPEGLRALEAAHPEIEVYVAAIDERLDENAYIHPGLGDAGDRLFGTPVD
ncbi:MULTISPECIES: uracil phosphoribosyltransferase [Thermomonas]|jgi:uracil phosphoribosyltransferase|uniref:Uracil phosphoribosyltransferase n=1 Tax=Thermomonas beijingensis TaxID=2872701 RepID=A0ABS7TFG7_9GAMM|nr:MULTISPECIES: uracil phosphoribosyltransferase [Thermomonas]MBS0460254.1 uracil phosphoribosyltransferase [Pseudomonadota bacterium]MDE2382643.1 uracil phosphoribosyltransferase [Xanthomonadaceae bacterium]MBZ4186612.1 uracil phosphoribosyltransferase [Thermomonas beijingensis]HOC10434.1 uracil phosphoribosyltransferase [Thermomonas sp.]HQA02113.1 uracil phosphoribosyltransferase [Thermomonas sp.]